MLELIKKCLKNDKIRYLIAGGCTTLVNLITFFLLRVFTTIDRNVCNVIAICMAIAFAYFANKFFVFRTKAGGVTQVIGEAVSFVGARLVSMAVEILGFAILCDSFRLSEPLSKVLVQFVVLVLNYLFSKLFVFKQERRSLKENIKDNYCIYISVCIVAVVMLAVCIAEKIMPFGPNSLTLVDSLHQYLPFFSEYRDKLLHEGSLFYTWNIALGSNFMSLSAYYLSSPFNYLFLLFDREHIVVAVTIILILKLALSAGSMAYFLSYKDAKKSRNPVIIGIAVAYAFSNYVIGYNWNVMWMDCIMVFPLIILGFKRLMEERDPKLYTLSLFYCLYCNYYIGFIICVFLVLWFFGYNHHRIRTFFAHGIRFALYSLLAGGMAAFLLVPAYYGIMATASAKAELPKWEWYGNIFNMFRQQLFLTEPITNQTFDGNVNLYCGMFAVFALFLYIFNGKIRLQEKLGRLLLLAILMVSFNSTTLNFIWHGMHDQYGIPNRFSFLYIFVLLLVAYDVLRHMRSLRVVYVIAGAALTVVFVVLCRLQAENGIADRVLTGSLVVLLVYAVLCCLYSGHVMKKGLFRIVFTGVCVAELVVAAAYGFGQNGYADYEGHYGTSKYVAAAYDAVKDMAEEENAGFYRAELMDTVLDESTWYSMPSVGTFCSTVLGDVVSTMGRLGFYTGANEFLYMGSTPFTNSILNVRYLLERDGDLNNFAFDYVKDVEGVGIYENPYPLSVGFCVSDNIKNWNRDDNLPLNNQNSLAYAMTEGVPFFSPVMPALTVASDTCAATVNNQTITYTPNQAGDASIMVAFVAERPGDYYINCRGNGINKIHIYVNGEEFAYDRYQIQIFHLGRLNEGDYVSIEYCYRNLSVEQRTASLYMATFDEAAYRSVYEQLCQNMLQVDAYDDGYISGRVLVAEGQTMFTSVPYDEGWSLTVDGKPAEYYKVCGAFIGIDLEPGEHTVTLQYMPRGLKPGLVITLCSFVLFMLGVMHNSNKKDIVKLVKNNNNEIDRTINI